MKFQLLTHEDAYIYGYLWADGTVYLNGRACNVGIEVADRLVIDLLVKKYGGSIYCRRRTSETGNLKKQTFTFKKQSVEFVESLLDLGFRSSSDKIPTELLPSFLVGFLDGDGCIYHSGSTFQLSFVSKIEEDWKWFHNAISRVDLMAFNESIRSSKCKALGKTTYSSVVRLTSGKAIDCLQFLYGKHKGPKLDRKYVKFLSAVKYGVGSTRARRRVSNA
jgi:hypothetical protein